MRVFYTLLPILFAAVFVHGVARADDPIAAPELKQLLSGNTAIGSTSRGTPYWVYRNPNGEQALETDSGYTDEGEWRITSDGGFCSKWEKIRDGDELCVKNYRVGDNRYKFVRPDGTEGFFKIEKGNPENL